MEENYEKFSDLVFEDFRNMANNNSLSMYEKIGFPDSYRKGKERAIFNEIVDKLPLLCERNRTVLEIGPGCSELPLMLIDLCEKNDHQLILIDSNEMLSHLPDRTFITKLDRYYPQCDELFADHSGKIDVIIAYSVLHYVFVESNIWTFLDRSLELLCEGGEMLIGDIPNISKRKRFFASQRGIEFHQKFTGTKTAPEVSSNYIEKNKIDDAVVLGLVARARAQGFEAYVVPQGSDLPMANRREDILINRS